VLWAILKQMLSLRLIPMVMLLIMLHLILRATSTIITLIYSDLLYFLWNVVPCDSMKVITILVAKEKFEILRDFIRPLCLYGLKCVKSLSGGWFSCLISYKSG
jgi:hypothetical protein